MPDITMCKGGRCVQKSTCYRFKATPSAYGQSYFMEIPIEIEPAENFNGECSEYWEVKK